MAHTLQDKGIDARVLEHGINGWRDTGRPLVTGARPYSSPAPPATAQ